MNHRFGRRGIGVIVIVAGWLLSGPTVAAEPTQHFSFRQQDLASALEDFGRQSGNEIFFNREDTRGRQASAVEGNLTAEDALAGLLAGTGLVLKKINSHTFLVERGSTSISPGTPSGGPERAGSSAEVDAAGVGTGMVSLQEVVVTAQKRSEHLQDIPAAISALPQDQLQRMRINGLEDLARTAPSLSFSELSPGEFRLSMRGIASQSSLAAVVGYYLDEVSFENRPGLWSGVSGIDFFDLDRIEVLRGPQGTLYGAGSMGGAVRLISTPPDPRQVEFKTEAGVATTDGGAPTYSAKGAYNQPLSDTAAVRVVLTHEHTGGFIDAALPSDYEMLSRADPIFARNENDSTVTTVRAALRWAPNASLSVTPSAFYRSSRANGFNYYQPQPGPEYVRHHAFTDRNDSHLAVGTLVIDGNLGIGDLTSVTSYVRKTWNGADDYSSAGANLYQAFTGSPVGLVLPLLNTYRLDYRQFSQEVRLTSPNAAAVRWIAGVRYSHYEDKPGGQYIADATLGSLVSSIFGVDPPSSVLLDATSESDYGGEIAGFGEATYSITSQFDVTAGLRAYRLSIVNNAGYLGGLLGSGPEARAAAQKNGLNPKLNLSYHFTSEILGYATASKGYRAGGPNASLLGSVGSDCQYSSAYKSIYDPDSVWTYEIGAKASIPVDELTINTAVYRTNWSHIQGQVDSNCGGFTANFGNARVNGAEIEINMRPTSQLRLFASASYTDAKFVSVDSILSSAVSIAPGDRVAGVPRTQASIGGEWSLVLVEGIKGYLRADGQYVGSAPASYTNRSADYLRPSYTTVNVSLGSYIRNFEVALYVGNLFNRTQIVDIVERNNAGPLYVAGSPRAVGATVRYHFR